jgi:two-component system, OmpR family, sensor kinase
MPRPLRSLRNRLTFIFALIVAGAIGIVYFYVTPRLEDELVAQKLERLAADARRESSPLAKEIGIEQSREILAADASAAARLSNSEVTLFQVKLEPMMQVISVADSGPGAAAPGDAQEVAERAVETGKPVTATAQTDVGRQALAAQPLTRNRKLRGVAVFAGSLSDVEANVQLIRQRILLAGAIALVLAAIGGYLVAQALTARIKRLEQAARKVAGGDFSNPIKADSDDEIGQLATAFDDMQRQLARLDTARKQFIASASHELRTPIFSLGGFLELLEDEELDEETRAAFLRQLRVQVDRLGKLATDLLDLSRLEAGSLELRPERTDVGELAKAVAAEFTPALAAHESHLEVRLAGGSVEALCDPERVAQIMRILLDNALSHTPAGTDVVVAASQDNGRARLAVTDFGPGIRRGDLERIFEPFFTSDDAQGSGLGLAIAHELAERMEGDLSAESSSGRTTFALELPA